MSKTKKPRRPRDCFDPARLFFKTKYTFWITLGRLKNLADAKKAHEWLGRVIKYVEAVE